MRIVKQGVGMAYNCGMERDCGQRDWPEILGVVESNTSVSFVKMSKSYTKSNDGMVELIFVGKAEILAIVLNDFRKRQKVYLLANGKPRPEDWTPSP
jgi:hypothetical protein